MDKIIKKVEELNKILVGSDVYQNYLYAKENLDDQSRQLVSVYKKLYHKYLSEGMDFEREKILSSEYTKLMFNERVKIFLQNESELMALIRKIYIKFAENLEVEMFE